MKRNENRSKGVTMADIAKALGVSNVTVSNALAGKKGVSAHVRAAVFLKARELGYIDGVSEETERAAVGTQEGDIGIIIPQEHLAQESGFCWQLYQELVTLLKKHDRYAILDAVSKEDENRLNIPRIIENHLVSGIIILGRPELKFLSEIGKRKIPMVFLDFYIRDFDFASISGDDYYDMYRMTSYVISHGHSNICYVAEENESTEHDKYYGYCRAMKEIETEPSQSFDVETAIDRIEEIKPTVFLCESLPLAQKIIKKLNEKSIAVPETVSVACVSDVRPEGRGDIACVCRDASQMAYFAVEALRSKLDGSKGIVGRISVGGKLIPGSSIRSLII